MLVQWVICSHHDEMFTETCFKTLFIWQMSQKLFHKWLRLSHQPQTLQSKLTWYPFSLPTLEHVRLGCLRGPWILLAYLRSSKGKDAVLHHQRCVVKYHTATQLESLRTQPVDKSSRERPAWSACSNFWAAFIQTDIGFLYGTNHLLCLFIRHRSVCCWGLQIVPIFFMESTSAPNVRQSAFSLIASFGTPQEWINSSCMNQMIVMEIPSGVARTIAQFVKWYTKISKYFRPWRYDTGKGLKNTIKKASKRYVMGTLKNIIYRATGLTLWQVLQFLIYRSTSWLTDVRQNWSVNIFKVAFHPLWPMLSCSAWRMPIGSTNRLDRQIMFVFPHNNVFC